MKKYIKIAFLIVFSLAFLGAYAQKKVYHTVRKGENLYSISKKYQTPIQQIVKWNNLSAHSRVRPGKILLVRKADNNDFNDQNNYKDYKNEYNYNNSYKNNNNYKGKNAREASTPKNRKYKVQAGDTPRSIAEQFGVTVTQLKNWNKSINYLGGVIPGTKINIAPPNNLSKAILNGALNGALNGLIETAMDDDDDENDEDISVKVNDDENDHEDEEDYKTFKQLTDVFNDDEDKKDDDENDGNDDSFDIKENTEFVSDIDENIPQVNIENKDAIAVIIGNKNYADQDVPSVDFAHRDAQSMKKYLMETFGYKEGNIIYIEDATQSKFYGVFGKEGNHKGQLYNYVKKDKSDVFIYYSGHGGPDPESKQAYFIPTDCNPNLVSLNGYSIQTFYDNLAKIPYKSLTVVIDACFSGASESGMLLKNISPVFINTQKTVLNDENALVFTSASGEQVSSWYKEQKHSLFTYYFLKGIQGEANTDGKDLTLKELKEYLDENVTYMARRLNGRDQTPEIHGENEKIVISY